jgi:DNA topoisomerase-3
MIAIIAEKPSVGQEIARVVGAHEKCSGYMQGHGYMVTWAFGHIVQLAIPELYGHKRYSELPLIPERFRLVVKQERTGGKNVIDSAASRQLNVIRRVLDKCESVIAATDAGREGELIFRRIYNHLGCKLPVKRLWVSSLTEEAIERGLREMRDGTEYDNLYLAADCRAKADWLVGINASAALARASEIGRAHV